MHLKIVEKKQIKIKNKLAVVDENSVDVVFPTIKIY